MRVRNFSLALSPLSAPALAAEPACWVPYADFEEHVRHIDAAACPGGAPGPGEGFCRFAVTGDAITIYVFREVGGQPCLVGAERLGLADFLARHGAVPSRRPPG